MNYAKTNINATTTNNNNNNNNYNDYINSNTGIFLQPLFEELEITESKVIRVTEQNKGNNNDDFLRRINILNRKRGYCEYIPSSIESIERYVFLAFGLLLSTSFNDNDMDGKEYNMTFYAVESPVMGTRWLPAELFASSISNSDIHMKRFKVTIFMNYYYIIILLLLLLYY